MRLAILGVGAGGVSLLNHLAELSSPEWAGGEILLFENLDCLGAGLAFNRDLEEAIINTGRSRLGALAPPFYPLDSYLSQSVCDGFDLNGRPLLREVYGGFLVQSLSRAFRILRKCGVRISLVPRRAEEVIFSTGKLEVLFEGKRRARVDKVVISIGTWGRKPPVQSGEVPYIPSPYPLKNTVLSLGAAPAVGILGSGLSAIDIASVYGKKGAEVHLFSPSGRLPWVQVESDTDTSVPIYLTEENVSRLRSEGSLSASSVIEMLDAELARFGMSRTYFDDEDRIASNWRDPYSNPADLSCHRVLSRTNHLLNAAFAYLSSDECRKMRENLGPGWSRYRVRVPLSRWRQMKKMIDDGQLILHSGVWANSSRLESILRDTGVKGLVNATGFSAGYEDAPHLLKQLAERGHIGLDESGRGLADYFTGQAISAEGKVQENLFLVGQAAAGGLLITSALDVINQQTKYIALKLSGQFRNQNSQGV